MRFHKNAKHCYNFNKRIDKVKGVLNTINVKTEKLILSIIKYKKTLQ